MVRFHMTTNPKRSQSKSPNGSDTMAPAYEPGAGREQINDQHDEKRNTPPFPVVGIGASAGGLQGIESFFDNMPPDTGMAFVIVQHLAAAHTSHMAELVGRYTKMPVKQVQSRTRIEPNHVYVIAPNTTLTLRKQTLIPEEPAEFAGHRNAIDQFFASLAEDCGERAVAVILSGAGSDGTLGIRAIKEHNGLTMAQTGAQHESMPQHAIATGVIDFVLPVEDMPNALLNYLKYEDELRRTRLPDLTEEIKSNLGKLAAILRRKTGHDFSQYKPNTIIRRTQRRMQLRQIESFAKYLALLDDEPAEVEQLFRDLLIGVTYFFRDRNAFEFIESRVLPEIIRGKSEDDAVRAWVPGCATGEEVYSLAILLKEQLANLDSLPNVQLFATDIDREALELGRSGFYGDSVTEQVSPERIARFFTKSGGGFKVNRDLRDMCLFSEHNLIRDPPFSRLDLVSCRNVLIYMDTDLQRRLMHLFHYALLPGGYLFVGPSESVAGHSDLFDPVDNAQGVYRRKDAPLYRVPPFFPAETRYQLQRTVDPKTHAKGSSGDVARMVDRMLLTHFGPPCVVVNRRNEVVYFSGRTGLFLQPPQGHPTSDVLEMARRGLRLELSSALHEVLKTGKRVVREGVTVQTNGSVHVIDLTVQPLGHGEQDPEHFVIVFQEATGSKAAQVALHLAKAGAVPSAEAAQQKEEAAKGSMGRLEDELSATKQHLQSTIEELESSNEELKSMNEELLSMNEELQSANEEVESSREELQSVNEELETVNSELAEKVKDLAHANDDLRNLFASTQIATVFLDNDMHIKGFTPAATEIFRLLESDLGRPLSDISTRFALGDLAADVQHVLRNLTPRERQVKVADAHDSWHLMRVLPYRTHENVINGVIITFVDLSAVKQAEESSARLAAIVESSADPIIGTDLNGRIISWNHAAQLLFGYTATEALGRPITIIVPPERRDEETDILARVRRGERLKAYDTVRVAKDGRAIEVTLSASPVLERDGTVIGKASILHDITERRRHEEHQRMLVNELDHRVKNTLATVSALCSQTMRESPSLESFKEAFEGRIQALASAHRQLSKAQWLGAELGALVEDTLAPHQSKDQANIAVNGPHILLSPKATMTLAIVLHELSTNAAKHGALSHKSRGRVEINWSIVENGSASGLRIHWGEKNSHPISPPGDDGFGTRLMRHSVEYELNGRLDLQFPSDGLVCTIDVPWTSEIGKLQN